MSLEDYSAYKLHVLRGGKINWKSIGKKMVAFGSAGLAALFLHHALTGNTGNPELGNIDYDGVPGAPQYPETDYSEPFINADNLGYGIQKIRF